MYRFSLRHRSVAVATFGAGRNELIRFCERCKGANQRVLLVHGEGTSFEALRSGFAERDVGNITVMDDKFTVEV